MKAVASNVVRALETGSVLKCADNSGPKEIRVISVISYHGRHKRRATCGVGSKITCSAVTGSEKTMHQVLKAVVIRQRKEFRRQSGLRLSFEDNAAVIITDDNEPKGTLIKGPVAKEATERFPLLAKVSSFII